MARDLGDALYSAITRRAGSGHGASMRTEPSDFSSALKWFVKAAGGNVSAAARLAGVPRRSLRDWLDGKSTPGAQRRRALVGSARLSSRRERLRPGREKRLRDPQAVWLTGSYNYDDDGDDRNPIRISDFLDDGTMDRVIDAYLAGADAAGLRETFTDGIADPFYGTTMALPPTDEHGWSVTAIRIV